MPKQAHKIENFHGGLNSNSDPRDVSDTHSSELSGIDVTNLGKLSLLKGDGRHVLVEDKTNSWVKEGYGLFRFSGDYSGADGDDSVNEITTDYLSLWDNQDNTLQIWTDSGKGWSDNNIINFGDFSELSSPVYYYVDGALRICDGNFSSNISNKWFGHIKRTLFQGDGYEINVDEWYSDDAELKKPVAKRESDVSWPSWNTNFYGQGKNAISDIALIYSYDNCKRLQKSFFVKTNNNFHHNSLYWLIGFTSSKVWPTSGLFSWSPWTNDDTIPRQAWEGLDNTGEIRETSEWIVYNNSYNPIDRVGWDEWWYSSRANGVKLKIKYVDWDGRSVTQEGNWGKRIKSNWAGTGKKWTIFGHATRSQIESSFPSAKDTQDGSIEDTENGQEDIKGVSSLYIPMRIQTEAARSAWSGTYTDKATHTTSYMKRAGGIKGFLGKFVRKIKKKEIEYGLSYSGLKIILIDYFGGRLHLEYDIDVSSILEADNKDDWTIIEVNFDDVNRVYKDSGASYDDFNYDDGAGWIMIRDLYVEITHVSSYSSVGGEGEKPKVNREIEAIQFSQAYVGPSGLSSIPMSGDFEFYQSWVYDKNESESLLTKIETIEDSYVHKDNNDNGLVLHESAKFPSGLIGFPTEIGVNCSIDYDWAYPQDSAPPISKRITGANLYVRQVFDITEENNKFYKIASLDFEDGLSPIVDYAPKMSDEDITWSVHYNSQPNFKKSNILSEHTYPFIHEYEQVNGFQPDVKSLTAKYKTSVVANRMTYIGNIKQNGEVHSDRMIKSMPNKFDVFPSEGRDIDVVIKDGDDIIKLEEYSDRLLQFKRNALYIINISQDIEFLEETHMYKGVKHPAAVCKTDFGIAWINKNGCFLFDGQKITNLIESKNINIIKKTDWEDFITNNSIIGYEQKRRELVIIDNCKYSRNKYVYSLVTGSWMPFFYEENLLTDGSLEVWSSSTTLTNWTIIEGTDGSSNTTITNKTSWKPHDGGYSLRAYLPTTTTQSGSVRQYNLQLIPGRTYTLSWWGKYTKDVNFDPPTIRVSSATALNGSIASIRWDGRWYSNIQYNKWNNFGDLSAKSVNKWNYYQWTFMLPKNLRLSDDWIVALYTTGRNAPSSYYLYIDDIKLTYGNTSFMTNFVNDWDGDLIYGSLYNKAQHEDNDVIITGDIGQWSSEETDEPPAGN